MDCNTNQKHADMRRPQMYPPPKNSQIGCPMPTPYGNNMGCPMPMPPMNPGPAMPPCPPHKPQVKPDCCTPPQKPMPIPMPAVQPVPCPCAACPPASCPSCAASYTENSVDRLPLSMAYVPWQKWQQPYPMNQAMNRGTIFPALDLPFLMGRCR